MGLSKFVKNSPNDSLSKLALLTQVAPTTNAASASAAPPADPPRSSEPAAAEASEEEADVGWAENKQYTYHLYFILVSFIYHIL